MGHGAWGQGRIIKSSLLTQYGLNAPLPLTAFQCPMPNAPCPILRFLFKHFNISIYIDAKFSEVSQNPSSLLDCRSKLLWAKRCAS
ncbi:MULTISPECIES: hypothetical protein [Nostoc]|uniref:Uncharacterized protein n=1 Tax=Nostoc paludosum FACHB-159 TaxID=2692908 RepID=A0ABR8K9D9_9NOSO|nr:MULTISPECIES: hypothetical protein [Nostoc]MBD2678688.1 hypothetical protein [Nostoc sp. FACHB-857]MBD2734737.1 hypothetical protein [Nostoc paludosum FACHB-159]